jgi:hypothetical protein
MPQKRTPVRLGAVRWGFKAGYYFYFARATQIQLRSSSFLLSVQRSQEEYNEFFPRTLIAQKK